MKYKTLVRLVLKLMGVWFFVSGTAAALPQLGWIGEMLFQSAWPPGAPVFASLFGVLASCFTAGFGCYLFFDGAWVLAKIIPDRPYCHECGYDLTGTESTRCPECGTPFDREWVLQGEQVVAESA